MKLLSLLTVWGAWGGELQQKRNSQALFSTFLQNICLKRDNKWMDENEIMHAHSFCSLLDTHRHSMWLWKDQ